MIREHLWQSVTVSPAALAGFNSLTYLDWQGPAERADAAREEEVEDPGGHAVENRQS